MRPGSCWLGERNSVDECRADPLAISTHNLLRGAFGLQICSIAVKLIVINDVVEMASSLDSCFRSFNVKRIRPVVRRLSGCATLADLVLLVP